MNLQELSAICCLFIKCVGAVCQLGSGMYDLPPWYLLRPCLNPAHMLEKPDEGTRWKGHSSGASLPRSTPIDGPLTTMTVVYGALNQVLSGKSNYCTHMRDRKKWNHKTSIATFKVEGSKLYRIPTSLSQQLYKLKLSFRNSKNEHTKDSRV